jgi:hypothetical protein
VEGDLRIRVRGWGKINKLTKTRGKGKMLTIYQKATRRDTKESP